MFNFNVPRYEKVVSRRLRQLLMKCVLKDIPTYFLLDAAVHMPIHFR